MRVNKRVVDSNQNMFWKVMLRSKLVTRDIFMDTLSTCGFQVIFWSKVTPKKLKWYTGSIVLLFIVILKLVIILVCFENIINSDFSTLSSSRFEFNQVVIFDISVFILFSMFMGVLRLPKVASVDIGVVSSAYMIKSNTELPSQYH